MGQIWSQIEKLIFSEFAIAAGLGSSGASHPGTLICISGMADNHGVLVSIDNIINTIMVEMFMPELLPLTLVSYWCP